MISRFAVIENSKISNVIYLDDQETDLILSLSAVEIPEGLAADIGCPYINGQFVIPVEELDTVDSKMLRELSFEEIENIIQSIIDENTTK